MSLLMKERATSCGLSPSSYAPIVQALNTLSDTKKARLKRKFDIAVVLYLATSESEEEDVEWLKEWDTFIDA